MLLLPEKILHERQLFFHITVKQRGCVVNCKDCKHSWQDIGGLCCSHGVCVDCTVPEDFFCAYGEKRSDFVDDNKIGERRTDANEPDGT